MAITKVTSNLTSFDSLLVDSNNTDTTITIESDLDGSSLFTSGIDLKRESVSKGSRIESIRDASAGGVGLNFLTTADNAAEVSGTLTSRMVILEDGNVGIGTDSPSDTLDIERATGVVSLGLQSRDSSDTKINFGDNNDGNVGIINYAHSDNSMQFTTNASERMRIDSIGRLMVNQTSASAASAGVKMQVNTDILSRGTYAGFFWENRSGITISGVTGWGGWYSTGTSVHSLYSDGANIVSINRSSGAYTALSDVNKKKDFEDSTVGLAEVMQLKPKKFRMIDDVDDAPKKLGFVAQDVENVIPEAYVEHTNEDASGVESTFIGLTDRPIIAALTKAIQELSDKVDNQQTIIDNLTTRIETLENA